MFEIVICGENYLELEIDKVVVEVLFGVELVVDVEVGVCDGEECCCCCCGCCGGCCECEEDGVVE